VDVPVEPSVRLSRTDATRPGRGARPRESSSRVLSPIDNAALDFPIFVEAVTPVCARTHPQDEETR
jgi:hypothetical protein